MLDLFDFLLVVQVCYEPLVIRHWCGVRSFVTTWGRFNDAPNLHATASSGRWLSDCITLSVGGMLSSRVLHKLET